MDDLDKDLVLQWYESLEDQLLDVIKYVPPDGQNLKNYSPKLASIIVEACGLLDSILRQITSDPAMVNGKTIPRKNLDIVHYAKLYASKFELPALTSILLISPPRYLCPFAGWAGVASGGSYNALSWWSIHAELKHDWIPNLKKAWLEVAIDALCALHQIIAAVPELGRAVLRRGWVPGKKISPQFAIEILEGKSNVTLLVERKLFVVTRGQHKFPAKIEDFRPSQYDGSERLIDFFGRW
jgi:hypothetical protein